MTENISPKISVIIPVYNVEKYIKEAVLSILNQTIQDFEILIIDDNSEDKTLEVIKSIKDSRIRIISKSINKGLVDSLNIGFKEAKGKFIARMDGDDISAPLRFEKQIDILEKSSHIKACGCWLQSFGISDRLIKHKETHREIQAHLIFSNPMSLGSVMLEKKAYEAFRFLENKIHAEDYYFWVETAWTCHMYNIQEVLYYYRSHPLQVSAKYKSIQIKTDVETKLFLFQKLEYNRELYTDILISKLLYSYEKLTLIELKLILQWFKELLKNNKKLGVFDVLEFKKTLSKIRRIFLFDIFFSNKRQDIDYNLRKNLFLILPIREKLFILNKKLKEKFKICFGKY